ncbi:hypothetical protein RQM47_02920 [Rubrivirga sp. S365]|uniref:Peptidase C-terminal archaeal/bacterial domain-containing protein n=1 Tax=Rubrivirga litoralis TaxID=3075598 RepID=A0ABU3BQW5_9BACT|nr:MULTISPECIES: hypothetical protein [unclassified Rubrivirga]MDT0631673.1 hypothetical protein [Rubrivirga sp. F394]MDT7855584.1 hypothetical protein [Rubrivirga sp. S365]
MPAFHRLDSAADARFLRAGQADPLTRVPFRPTNAVVLCATCGTVSLRETWEAVGGCPNGHDTAAPWDPERALAAGDGAAGGRPTLAHRPDAERGGRRWLLPALLALGAVVLVVGGLVLTGRSTDDPAPVEAVPDAPAEPTGPEAVIVEAGEAEGALTDEDFRTENGRYQDLYSFAADSSGLVLAFTLQSGDFLPDLTVETPEGERVAAETVADNEDTGERTVAVRDLRGPGLYRLFVTSRRPEDTGDYVLRIRQEAPVRPIEASASVSATLGEFSERADGFFRDRYRFSGAEGREHTVTVRSSAFAPTVEITGPGGAVRGETGRAGGSVTYTFTPEATGTYTAVVSSRTAGQRGAYSAQLAVSPEVEEPDEEAGPPAEPLPTTGAPVSDTLAVGATRPYRFRGQPGDRVRLEVRAEGFVPTLVLVGPDGTRVPAAPDGDRARIRFTLPSGGAYRVVVGGQGGGGLYRLTLETERPVTGADIPRLPGQAPAPPPPPADGGRYRPQPIDNAP